MASIYVWLAVSLLLVPLAACNDNASGNDLDTSITSQGSNALACILQYGSITSSDYCMCMAGVSENFACTYDCQCDSIGLNCEASLCHLTSRAVGLIVVASLSAVLGVCSCIVLCCYLSKNRRRHHTYIIVDHSGHLPSPHHYQQPKMVN